MASNQFVDALKLFLDTADSAELEGLALRLKPYRIETLPTHRQSGRAAVPMLVLDRASAHSLSLPFSDSTTNGRYFYDSVLSATSNESGFDLGSGSASPSWQPGLVPTPRVMEQAVSSHTPSGSGEEEHIGRQFNEAMLSAQSPITDFLDSPLDLPPLPPSPSPSPSMPPQNPSQINRQPVGISSSLPSIRQNQRTPIPREITSPTTPPINHAQKSALLFNCCIRKDFHPFLTTNLPHWIKHGLWRTSPSTSSTPSLPLPHSTPSSSYTSLSTIYSCVAKLDTRIEYDQIRKRIALVLLHSQYLESYRDWKTQEATRKRTRKLAVGRGDMTLMIDNILHQTTVGWEGLEPKRRARLRALFHERKRYGKRWDVLRAELGPGILVLCSGQLANMVSNTKVTMAVLRGISSSIKACEDIMRFLRVLDPLAESLIDNEGFNGYAKEVILEQLEAVRGVLQDDKSEGSD